MARLPSRIANGGLVATLVVSAITLSSFGAATPAQAIGVDACAGFVPAIANGGFESPTIPANTYQMIPSANSASPGAGIAWNTTDTTKVIELWHSGFNGVPSDTGTQFAELNANQVATLSQDLATTPGFVLLWSIAHRGRSGVDTMTVSIGPPAGPMVVQTPSGAATPDISDGNAAWGHYHGVYAVPAGQTTTRFAFNSVSAAGGNQSIGNFLDSVVFTVAGSACDDSLIALSGQSTPLDVLANDHGNGLSITAVTTPAHGTATISGGKVVYTPAAGYIGTDSVDYTIVDSFGVSDTATATITVPLLPTAAPLTSSGVGTASQTATAAVPTGGSSALLDASAQPVTTRTIAGQGTYSIVASTGVITFAPVLGFQGLGSVPYRVSDSYGQTAASTYRPTVTPPAGPAPTAKTSTGSGINPQTASLTIPTGGAVTLLDGSGNPAASRTVAGQGKYTLDTSTGVATFTPALGFTGIATPVTYRVTDAYGQTGQSTYTPTVTLPAAPAPTAKTSTGVGTAAQSATLTIPNGGAVTLLDGSGNPVTTRTVAGQGIYALDTATGVVTFSPVLGFTGQATPVPYRVTDAYGQTGQSTYTPTVTVPAGPTAPARTSTGVGTATQSTTVPVPASGSATLLDGTGTAVTSLSVAGEGSYLLDPATGLVTFHPVLGFAGVATPVAYRITDAYGQSAQSTYTATVTPPAGPSAPAKTSTGVGTAQQSALLPIPTQGSVTLLNGASAPVLTRTFAGQGSYTLDPATGVVTFDPVLGFTGPATPAPYRITDAYGQTDQSTYTPTVTAPTGPTAAAKTSTGAGTAQQSALLAIPTQGSVTLLSSGGSPVLTRTIAGQGVYGLDATTGVVTFDPVLGFTGVAAAVTYRVTDAYGQTAQSTYTPTVTLPAGPTALPLSSTGVGTTEQSVTPAIPTQGSLTLLDTAGLATTNWSTGQGGYALDPTTGVVTFDPVLGFTGNATPVSYQVTDAYGQTAQSTYTPNVAAPSVPTPPPLTSTGVGIAVQSATLTIPALGSVTLLDQAGHPVTGRTVSGQGSYSLDAATGLVSFAPVLGYTGTASAVTYQVTDAYGNTAMSTYTPTVTVPPGPPAGPLTSDGVGTTPQHSTLPVPVGGSAALLNGQGQLVNAVTIAGEGTYSLDPASGLVTFTPVLGFQGSTSPVGYRVTDAYGQTADATYTPSVAAPSAVTPPPLVSSGPVSRPQQVTPTMPPSGSITLLDSTGAPATSVVVPGEGRYTLDPTTGDVVFQPVFGFSGPATPVTYRTTDVYGQTATATYTPTVVPPRRPYPPEKRSTGMTGDTQSVHLTVPSGGKVRLVAPDGSSVTSLTVPGQGRYSLDPASGVVTFHPTLGFLGKATPLVYRVTDAYGQNGAASYLATVLPEGSVPPAIQPPTAPPSTPAPVPGQLPFTGGDNEDLVRLAVLLLTVGGVLMAAATRRRRRDSRTPRRGLGSTG